MDEIIKKKGEMKWMIPVLIILVGLCICMGCTQIQVPSTSNITGVPTPLIMNVPTTPTATPMPVRAITISPTAEPTLEEEIVPDWTEVPTVIPTAEPDTTKINFIQFVDDDFMAKYPNTWAVVCQTFTLDDTTLYGQDIWQKEGRMVAFTSEDGRTKMKVSVRDFLNPGPGRYTFIPTIDSARKSVAMLFPNASSETSVYNYKYKQNDQQVSTSSYDVIFTPSSEYYPYTYTEETWTTYHHMFNVDFIVMNGMTLDDYRELRYLMMKSILTEGTQTNRWW